MSPQAASSSSSSFICCGFYGLVLGNNEGVDSLSRDDLEIHSVRDTDFWGNKF